MAAPKWSLTAKICGSCKTSAAAVFCSADTGFFCTPCDAKVHAVNKLAPRHARVWLCEVCEQAPARVTCKADAAALCAACDRDIHSANPLARRHERVPVAPFYGAVDRSSPSEDEEAEAWLVPYLNADHGGMDLEEDSRSPEYLFRDMDPYLDLDLLSSSSCRWTELCRSIPITDLDTVITWRVRWWTAFRLTKWIIRGRST